MKMDKYGYRRACDGTLHKADNRLKHLRCPKCRLSKNGSFSVSGDAITFIEDGNVKIEISYPKENDCTCICCSYSGDLKDFTIKKYWKNFSGDIL